MGFRENLKAQLQFSGMLVKELAAISGVKKATIDSYLREKGYTPSVEAAVSIARALGVTVEQLVLGADAAPAAAPAPVSKIPELTERAGRLTQRDLSLVCALAELLEGR
jgi:transcriptional regulator with XRE-family HTH domain